MIISIIAFLVSLIPAFLIFFWLRKRKKDDELYVKSCNSSFLRGLIATFPIIGLSAVLYVILRIVNYFIIKDVWYIYHAFYAFIVLVLVEEFVKFFMFKGLIKKKFYEYTWADVTAFMVIIGLAFGLSEDIPYAFGASPAIMLVRGFTMGHIGYGFIMGWFYGKRLYTGKKKYAVIGFLLPYLIHGIYDYSLEPKLLKINDNLAFIAISLAVLDLVLLGLMIRFFIKARKKERYNVPVISIPVEQENVNGPEL